MKRSDSTTLPLALKRPIRYEEEQRKSPVGISGGGKIRDRKLEIEKRLSSKNLQKDSNHSDSRRGLGGVKHVDNLFQTAKTARDLGESVKGPLGLSATGPGSRHSTSLRTSTFSRDFRRRSDSTSYQGQRGRGHDKEDDKISLNRRKWGSLSSSNGSIAFPRASQRVEKSSELSTSNETNFREFGSSNGNRAGDSFSSEDSSSVSSLGSASIATKIKLDNEECQIGSTEGASHNDNNTSSSSGSTSPLSINTRLTEMKFQKDNVNRSPTLTEQRLPGPCETKSSHSSNFNPVFPGSMASSAGMQRDSLSGIRRSRVGGKDVGGLVGLNNEGNTCYLNSCLQCLAHSMALASAVQGPIESLLERKWSSMRAGTSKRDWSSPAQLLTYSFRQVVKDLWQRPAFTATSARVFLQCVQAWAPQFAGHSQHDAQEVLRAILDGLHEALNTITMAPPYRDLYLEPKPEDELADLTWRYHKLCQDSIIQDIFCGQLQSTIECCTCHRKSHCFDPFHDLSLPLPKSSRDPMDQYRSNKSRPRVTLHDCLSAFVAPEQLEGSNKYYCPGCKAPRTSMKKLTLYRLPPVLVLHVKRFYKTERFSYQKDDTPVYYPLQGLDFTDFLSARARRPGRQGVLYDLYGVCCHMGSLGCGHYTAQCRNCENDSWYCFNDSSVSPLQDAAVLSSSAYILFYQQRTSS